MAKFNWTEPQFQAIYDRKETLLVSAAAGSGKTAVLTQRAVSLLTDAEHPVEANKILMVTFSRAAAAEMKERINKRLEEALQADPDNPLLLRQQLLMNQARISTISAFCLDLVRQNFTLLNQSPDFQIAQEDLVEALKKSGVEQVVSYMMDNHKEAFWGLFDFLGVQRDTKVVEKSLLSLFDFLETVPFPEKWMEEALSTYEGVEKVEQTVWGKGILRAFQKQLKSFVKEMREALELSRENEEVYFFYRDLFESEIEIYESLINEISGEIPWDNLCNLVNGVRFETKVYRKCPDINLKNFIYGDSKKKGKRNQVKEAYQNFCKEYFGKKNDYLIKQLKEVGEHTKTLFQAVSLLREYVKEQLKMRNVLSFSDVEHLALALLIEEKEGAYIPTQLAKKLSREIDCIFIDEYQDTNDLQDLIFTALSKEGKNLFIVGDIKQSIYSFRKAKPSIFLKKKESFTPFDKKTYPAKIILGENFRSKKGVTEAINFVFTHIMSKEVGDIAYDEEERLIAAKKEIYDQDTHLDFFVLERNKDQDPAFQEARAIAKKIHQMVQEKVLVEKDGALIPCTYSDFVILLRSHTKTAHLYQKALKEVGVSAVSQGGEDLFRSKEILTAIDFLKVIDNQSLDISVASLLLSGLFGMSPDELLKIREKDVPLYISVKNSENKKAKRFIKIIERYRSMASVASVFEVLEDFLSYTKFESLVQVMEPTFYRLGNLKLLLEMAGAYNKTSTGSVSGFLTYLERLRESGRVTPSAEAPVLDSEQVRIMSIHKSKGLEFPFVVLGGLYKKFNDQFLRNDVLISEQFGVGYKKVNPNYTKEKTLPYQLAALEEKEKSLSEEMRILYVALTRAIDKLMVFAYSDDMKLALEKNEYFDENNPVSTLYLKSAKNFSQWLLAPLLRLEETRELQLIYKDECKKLLKSNFALQCNLLEEEKVEAGKEPEKEIGSDETIKGAIREKLTQSYEFPQDTILPNKMSVSALNVTLDKEGHEFQRRPKFLSQEGLTPAERGNAVHKFMQFADYSLAAVEPEQEIERMVKLQFISKEEGQAIAPKKISHFFSNPIGKLTLESEKVYREYKLMSYIDPRDYFDLSETTTEKILVQGIADCIVETPKGMVIIDYKTDFVKSEEELKERYKHQLSLYKAAIEKSLSKKVSHTVLYSFSLDKAIFL